MIQIEWKGFDLKELEYAIAAEVKQIEFDAYQALDDISRSAVDEMYRILVNATTDTGRDREARGEGIAGRVDTGQMARDISAALDTDMDGSVVLTWGWVKDVQLHYLIQEYGSERIAAMSALQQSYVNAREKLRQRLQDMGLEVS